METRSRGGLACSDARYARRGAPELRWGAMICIRLLSMRNRGAAVRGRTDRIGKKEGSTEAGPEDESKRWEMEASTRLTREAGRDKARSASSGGMYESSTPV